MARLHLSICLITFICVAPQGCWAEVGANLIKSLLTNYDVSARPIANQSEPTIVKIGMMLQQIVNLDERQQQLQLKVWHRYYWKDDFLTWNPSEHGGIKSIKIIPSRIWRPDITLYDDMTNENYMEHFQCTVTHDGTVQWYIPHIITSNCNVDVYHYPWDEQTCRLKFGSWSYDHAELDVLNASSSGDLTSFTTSGEWSILSFNVERNVIHYNCCPNPYPDVTFTLHIRRKTMYFWANILLPAMLIMFTCLLVFYLPPQSGEKVSLCVTVLLALIVFLLLVAESVPQSDSVPTISRFFGASGILVALSTISTIFTLRIHHRGVFGNKVPAWMRKVVLNWMARALCMKEKVDGCLLSPRSTKVKKSSVMPTPHEHTSGNAELISIKTIQTNEMITTNGKSGGNHETQGEKQHEDTLADCSREWMLVAAVFDRFLLVIFSIITAGTTVGILLNHPYSDLEPIA